jgi:hypothetical protein
MKNVEIALLIWQRNRVAEALGPGPDTAGRSPIVIEAWDGIVNLIDSIVDEAHPRGTPLPPPYRPWQNCDGERRPATTRECWIDYVDANGGLPMAHKLWSEYSEYCREAGVDPLIREEW